MIKTKLISNSNPLNNEIINAIQQDYIQNLINEEEFHFQLAREKFNEFLNFPITVEINFDELITKFRPTGDSYENRLNQLEVTSDPHKLMKLIAELVAYCDFQGWGKNEFNLYEDKRVLAKSQIRQNIWAQNLLNYKKTLDLSKLSSPGVQNAIRYLSNPSGNLTMLKEDHREMVSKFLLKQSYNKDLFVNELITFFKPYNITPINPENLTYILTEVLYRGSGMKPLWFEGVEGLVVCDNTGWINDAIAEFEDYSKMVFWWNKSPSGGGDVIKLLKERIEISDKHSFYIYYTIHQKALYRAKVIDFALEADYPNKTWNKNKDVGWYQDNFSDYKGVSNNSGNDTKAKIAFLIEKIEQLSEPISMDQFEFYKKHAPPTQNNMQPYSDLLFEDVETIIPMVSQTLFTQLAFESTYRKILTAIQTKPFILLAGLSGTGKSRLVRTLAYKTCSDKKLQLDKPMNFELIKVRSNWHDSSDLLGYMTRIHKEKHTPTKYLKFIIRAWQHTDTPFFLCLDEMNLAPVEQYFAEYLSIIETRKKDLDNIKTDNLFEKEDFEKAAIYEDLLIDLGLVKDSPIWNKFILGGISLPPNLIVMGTVNMDETTHSFSRWKFQ